MCRRFPGAMPLAVAERRVAAAFPAEPFQCFQLHNVGLQAVCSQFGARLQFASPIASSPSRAAASPESKTAWPRTSNRLLARPRETRAAWSLRALTRASCGSRPRAHTLQRDYRSRPPSPARGRRVPARGRGSPARRRGSPRRPRPRSSFARCRTPFRDRRAAHRNAPRCAPAAPESRPRRGRKNQPRLTSLAG